MTPLLPWNEAVDAYLAVLAEQHRSDATLELTRRWLSRFSSFAIQYGASTPSQVTARLVTAFQNDLWWQTDVRGRLYSASSRCQCLQMVRAFLRWGCQAGQLTQDPAAHLVLRKPVPPTIPLLTDEELVRLMAQPDVTTPQGCRDHLVLKLFYHTGIERGEAHSLNTEDVDLATSTLMIRTGRMRQVSFDTELSTPLSHYLTAVRPQLSGPDEPALFLHARGRRLGADTFGYIILDTARQAGLRYVNLQLLRRSGVARHFAAGESLEAIQALLGHRHRDNTRTYRPLEAAVVEISPRSAAMPSTSQSPSKDSRPPFYRRSKEASGAES